MNTILTTPDVKIFVAAVRDRLTDLTEEEREELVGGLDADVSDLVAERGVEALPDPGEYAAELRTAAGFPAEAPSVPSAAKASVGDRVNLLLDSGRDRWLRFAGALPGEPWELVVSLRPVWWVLRAWVALQTVDVLWGSGSYNYGLSPIPSLMGWGLPLLVVAVVLSVQLGRGRLWPGTPRRGLFARLLLLGLNVFAIAMTPVAFDGLLTPDKVEIWYGDQAESATGIPETGLSFNGLPVANIYPYDAQGHALTGVQLVDRQGRRLAVTRDPYEEGTGWGDFTLVPWLNGRTELYSVFPLPEQTLDPDTAEPLGEPRLQAPPFASLPRVEVAGVQPSVLASAEAPAQRSVTAEQTPKPRR